MLCKKILGRSEHLTAYRHALTALEQLRFERCRRLKSISSELALLLYLRQFESLMPQQLQMLGNWAV